MLIPGENLSILAAQALASLSESHPTPELLQALPHMKDLPRIAEAPKTTENLPRPANFDRDLDG